MKVLVLPHAYPPVLGGAENFAARLSEELARCGHHVRVVTTNVGGVEAYSDFGTPGLKSGRERIGGVDVIRLAYSNWVYEAGSLFSRMPGSRLRRGILRRIRGLLTKRLEMQIEREIGRFGPDVVLALPHLLPNVVCATRIWRRDAFPLVLVPMLHEFHVSWNMQDVRDALRCAGAVMAMTLWEAERLCEAYGVQTSQVHLGSAAVDSDDFQLGDAPRDNTVLFLGRMSASKGIDLLIDAMKLVWMRHRQARLVLAGPGEAAVADLLGDLTDEERERVVFAGSVTEEAKNRILASARCLVLPSKVESFGLVLLEAWNQATPVVTWDLPVFRSIVSEGHDGLLARLDDVEHLAEKILSLLRDPASARSMGKNGRLKVEAQYRWGHVADAYLRAFREAINAFRNG